MANPHYSHLDEEAAGHPIPPAEFHPGPEYLKGEDGQYPTPDHALAASYRPAGAPATDVKPAPRAGAGVHPDARRHRSARGARSPSSPTAAICSKPRRRRWPRATSISTRGRRSMSTA